MRILFMVLAVAAALAAAPCSAAPEADRPFAGRIGETIVYDVKTGMIRLGSAVFREVSEVEFEKTPAYVITFETRVTGLYDLEKIYCDRENFLPMRIERDVRQWSSQEIITEEYDQKKFVLTVIKKKGPAVQSTTIRKNGPIQNAVLLPHYVRRIPDLGIGWTMEAHLPTKDLAVKLVSVENVRVPAGIFKAYHFESTPKQVEIWITADARRLPVKIVGSGGFGYSMIMREYKPE